MGFSLIRPDLVRSRRGKEISVNGDGSN